MYTRTIFFFILIVLPIIVIGQSAPEDFINYEFLNSKTLIVKAGTVYPDQVVAVKSEKGIILFDAGISPTLTLEYRKIIEREFNCRKFIYVVNTHHHFDHTNGNQVFEDAEIIAHENCKAAMIESSRKFDEFLEYRRGRYKRRDELARTLDPESDIFKKLNDLVFTSSHMCNDLESIYKLTLPEITFNDYIEIDLGDMTLKLFSFTPGFHTDNDVVAVIPELGLVFTGDIIREDESLYWITSKHDHINAVKVLGKIIGSCNEMNSVITIHGGVMLPERLIDFRDKLYEMMIEKDAKKSAVLKLENDIAKYSLKAALNNFKDFHHDDDYYLWEGDLIALADESFQEGSREEAVALFELCTRLFPKSVNAYEWLGDVYYQIEKYEDAKDSFKKAIELYPFDSFAADMIYQIDKKLKGEYE